MERSLMIGVVCEIFAEAGYTVKYVDPEPNQYTVQLVNTDKRSMFKISQDTKGETTFYAHYVPGDNALEVGWEDSPKMVSFNYAECLSSDHERILQIAREVIASNANDLIFNRVQQIVAATQFVQSYSSWMNVNINF